MSHFINREQFKAVLQLQKDLKVVMLDEAELGLHKDSEQFKTLKRVLNRHYYEEFEPKLLQELASLTNNTKT